MGAVAKERVDKLRAEIEALAAALQAAVSDQVHFLVPGYWRLGEMLEASSGDTRREVPDCEGEASVLSGTASPQILSHFGGRPGIRRKLRHLREITRKGIKGREPASAVDKALEALLDAVDGNPEEAVRLVIDAIGTSPMRWIGLRRQRNRRASLRCRRAFR